MSINTTKHVNYVVIMRETARLSVQLEFSQKRKSVRLPFAEENKMTGEL